MANDGIKNNKTIEDILYECVNGKYVALPSDEIGRRVKALAALDAQRFSMVHSVE
jgi:hypothetical protein